MTKIEELESWLTGLSEQLEKATGEILGRIDQLEKELDNAGVLPEGAVVALANLKAAVQRLDDIVPDPEESSEPEEPPGEPDAGP